MSYIAVRGRLCHTIVPKLYAKREYKIGDVKISFFKELERVFDKFPEYHIKIILKNDNAKVGKEDIFKPTIWNENLHEISNHIGVRVANLATFKNLTDKVRFSHISTSINIFARLQMGKCTIRLTIF
jgi:hypothetical protein